MEAVEVTGMEDDRLDTNMGGNDMDNNKTEETRTYYFDLDIELNF